MFCCCLIQLSKHIFPLLIALVYPFFFNQFDLILFLFPLMFYKWQWQYFLHIHFAMFVLDLPKVKQKLFSYLAFVCDISLCIYFFSSLYIWVQNVSHVCNHEGFPTLPNVIFLSFNIIWCKRKFSIPINFQGMECCHFHSLVIVKVSVLQHIVLHFKVDIWYFIIIVWNIKHDWKYMI